MVTHPRVINPAVCSASISASLNVGATTIAKSAMGFFALYATSIVFNTTIFCDIDLCIVQCRCLFDLPFDDSKCVHCFTPKVVGF